MRDVPGRFIAGAFVLLLGFAALGGAGVGSASARGKDKLQVVATYSIVYDIVKTIGQERVDVYSMVPLGQDPHEYTPLPLDVQKAADADVIFWNGLNMELGDGWFDDLLHVAGKKRDDGRVFELAKGVQPMYVTDGATIEMNPHAYLSVPIAIRFVQNARDGLKQVDPENATFYEQNAREYIARLEDLHREYGEKIGEVPEKRRVLVTAERAFQYMAAEYGLREGYVWAIDTEEQGTPQQIMNLIRFVRDNDVSVLFMESNVDPRALETVSRETGVPIYGKLYSDELGSAGEQGGTFLGLLEWNLKTIYAGLMGH